MKQFGSRSVLRLRCRRASSGFTLVELLVVIAIVALLSSMLIPALSKAKGKAQGIHCLNNIRQLALGWLMYADDHEGALCPNAGGKGAWVEGIMSFDTNFRDNTNILYLADPRYAKLAPYVPSAGVYRCPADRSDVRVDLKTYRRVRTLAMNEGVGSNAEGTALPAGFGWKVFRKMNEIIAPSPSQLWILIEQHPDSINDGRFAVDCQSQNTAARLIDFPANFHNNASALSFADGHAEMHRWLDSRTLQPNLYCGCLSHYAAEGRFISAPNSPDVAWLQSRTSVKRN